MAALMKLSELQIDLETAYRFEKKNKGQVDTIRRARVRPKLAWQT